MLLLNPNRVTLGTAELTNVSAITIDRTARRAALEWTDLGPHIGFADVPEQRVAITVIRNLFASELSPAKPGDELLLTARAAASASAAGVIVVSATVVVQSISHAITQGAKATQIIRAVAVSSTGAADPITETLTQGET